MAKAKQFKSIFEFNPHNVEFQGFISHKPNNQDHLHDWPIESSNMEHERRNVTIESSNMEHERRNVTIESSDVILVFFFNKN